MSTGKFRAGLGVVSCTGDPFSTPIPEHIAAATPVDLTRAAVAVAVVSTTLPVPSVLGTPTQSSCYQFLMLPSLCATKSLCYPILVLPSLCATRILCYSRDFVLRTPTQPLCYQVLMLSSPCGTQSLCNQVFVQASVWATLRTSAFYSNPALALPSPCATKSLCY